MSDEVSNLSHDQNTLLKPFLRRLWWVGYGKSSWMWSRAGAKQGNGSEKGKKEATWTVVWMNRRSRIHQNTKKWREWVITILGDRLRTCLKGGGKLLKLHSTFATTNSFNMFLHGQSRGGKWYNKIEVLLRKCCSRLPWPSVSVSVYPNFESLNPVKEYNA